MTQRMLVFSALWAIGIGAVLLVAAGCGSGAPRGGEGAPEEGSPPAPEETSPPAPAETSEPPAGESKAPPEGAPPAAGEKPGPETAAAKPAETAVPSSGPVEPAAGTTSGPEQILPSTRRSATGLPDPISGYLSWFRLGPSPAPEAAAGAHAPARQAYVLFPKQEEHTLGGTVKPPFDQGTIIALEEKEPGKDFISRVRVMTVEESGWKFTAYGRDAGDKDFAPRSGGEAECAACHAKAKDSDSVYSSRKLE